MAAAKLSTLLVASRCWTALSTGTPWEPSTAGETCSTS